MGVLTALQPEGVFSCFEEITRIPHGSGNTSEISNELKHFAEERKFKCSQDAAGNVVIFVPGTHGGENASPVMLQGHMDMVCEKNADSRHNFKNDPLELSMMDDFIFARGTTLGGDDGIALAFCLAIADDPTLTHPPLELVFTVDEEIGMLGAKALDTSSLKARRLINLDSEEEGKILLSCAGGLTGNMRVPVKYTKKSGQKYQIIISGLKGGHSGSEIHKYQANANILLGRLLHFLGKKMHFDLVNCSGGLADNAIPREADATVLVGKEDFSTFEAIIREFSETIKNEYRANEDNIQIYCNSFGESEENVLVYKTMERVIFLLNTVPDGVQKMCQEPSMKGLVETSLNIGIMRLGDRDFCLTASVRSSIESAKHNLSDKLKYLTETIGGSYDVAGEYPGWEYDENSKLLAVSKEVFTEVYGHEPVAEGIHAGLECGILADKIPGLEIISIGPDVLNIHTPNEKLSISSVQRTWRYLTKLLEALSSS
ncbi:MAG: aminoacyl-histidine dipeptidase [Lachnospiraceae bacterium]|nr:aminoacyl-histidine dipeptidase [Lachnospiraceae bacterium]